MKGLCTGLRLLPAAVAAALLASACSGFSSPGASSENLILEVSPATRDIPAYDRDEWYHWIDEDGDCQNTRHETLIAESASPVTYKDAEQCKVASGEWLGPYTGERFTDPGNLDIDHMVPLANAHRSGGWAWDEARKRQYANDLSYNGHLIAVQNSANRAKGASGPEEWRPPNRGHWCQYAIDWIGIKRTWDLTATDVEVIALSEMLHTCDPPRSLGTLRYAPLSPPTTTPRPNAVYAHCQEAEAAGEERVQGSRGNAHGFPQDMVPGARDGDGDGVVCER